MTQTVDWRTRDQQHILQHVGCPITIETAGPNQVAKRPIMIISTENKSKEQIKAEARQALQKFQRESGESEQQH
jgi:hypothetical protein